MPEVTKEPPGKRTDLIMCCVTGFSSKSSGRRWPKSRDKVSDFSKPCDFGQEVKCPGYVWQKASSAINAELPYDCSKFRSIYINMTEMYWKRFNDYIIIILVLILIIVHNTIMLAVNGFS